MWNVEQSARDTGWKLANGKQKGVWEKISKSIHFGAASKNIYLVKV